MKPPVSKNYCATVVELKDFVQLTGCDNVQGALIFGNQVIVGKDAKAGDVGLFFPLETALSKEFLSANNLYRDAGKNTDKTVKGFFEENGRVRAVKFRGHQSEGFYIPIYCLTPLGCDTRDFMVGDEFDQLHGDIPVCHKYTPKHLTVKGSRDRVRKDTVSKESLIADSQFRFHPDTQQLRKNIDRIAIDSIISITDKWHGTSVVIGNLLVKRRISYAERILRRFGVKIQEYEYAPVVSSRKVIKSVGSTVTSNQHWYTDDVWGEWGKIIAPKLPAGFTVYAEIVGYTSGGSPIQKDYTYQCKPKQSRLLVYRVTVTNTEGTVTELTWPQLKEFCSQRDIETVRELYCGNAWSWLNGQSEYFVALPEPNHALPWGNTLLSALSQAYLEKKCPYNPGHPNEGIVVRLDGLGSCEAYKLKSFAFLEKETKDLDKGTVDLETIESEGVA